MLFLFSMVLSSLVTSQYVVYHLQTHMFPNSSYSASDGSTCNVNTSSEEYQQRTAVQKSASHLNIFIKISDTIPALITSAIIGGLSDRFGRTRILTFNALFCCLATCCSSVIIYFDIDIYYFLISSILYSAGGGLYGALSIGYAYISDVTSPGKQRTLMITFLEASIGIGSGASGLVSGYIIESIGFFYANICVCASAACSVLVVVLFLPYSRPPELLITNTSFFENARASFTFYIRASPRRHKYILAITIFLTAALSLLGKQSTEILYQLNAPFCWSSIKVGYYSAISLSSTMVLGVAIVKVLHNFFSEETIAIFSGISGIAACTVEAFAIKDVVLFMVPVIGFLSALVFPMTRSILSKLTSPDRQGALFAGIAVVEIVANLGSNAGAAAIYIATVGTMRGFVFLCFAGLSFVTTCLLLIYRIINRRSQTVPIANVTADTTGTQVLTQHEGD
ncbi:solute carrier family 46 member 3-like [Pecten maximus]|uniref:solute carrier family 46 member 3-like n=1 Tax=Pecten maximus TaxID=6579 RepID=UPI0014586CB0|nr:solute carrier family 46 member 3-like [Pecten maximus]